MINPTLFCQNIFYPTPLTAKPVNLPNQVLLYAIGFDDRESLLNCHVLVPSLFKLIGINSDVEAFTATALAGNIRIAEAERLVQAVFDKIDLGTIDELQRLRIDNDGNALVLEHDIRVVDLIGVVDDIRISGTTALGNAQTQSNAAGALFKVGADPLGGRIR